MNNDVVKFIEACDQEPNAKNIELYQKLIREEFDEFVRDSDDFLLFQTNGDGR